MSYVHRAIGWCVVTTAFGFLSLSASATTPTKEGKTLAERFEKIEHMETIDEISEILGSPDRKIPWKDGGEVWVWKEKRFGLVRGTAIVKFRNDRMAWASHSSRDVNDIEGWVKRTEKTKKKGFESPTKADPPAPLVRATAEPWTNTEEILDSLESSGGLRPDLDAAILSAFDSITETTSFDELAKELGKPLESTPRRGEVTYRWDVSSGSLSATLSGDAVTSKSLDALGCQIIVAHNYWKVSDAQSGVTVTSYVD